MHRRGPAGCIWFPFRDLRLSQTADVDGHFGRRLLGRQCLDLHIPGELLRFHALSGTRPALPKGSSDVLKVDTVRQPATVREGNDMRTPLRLQVRRSQGMANIGRWLPEPGSGTSKQLAKCRASRSRLGKESSPRLVLSGSRKFLGQNTC